ncbi:hypothetical protein NPIL_301841 [Nephila pilipes]|uniref:Uncharacterized protein n=1 Tax=Nephila pilipes TaxID=299642 RepID=A0A8X6PLW2_NEPPI|nr:hypothetical protein NPIL_301841 [Nephila pilipes]
MLRKISKQAFVLQCNYYKKLPHKDKGVRYDLREKFNGSPLNISPVTIDALRDPTESKNTCLQNRIGNSDVALEIRGGTLEDPNWGRERPKDLFRILSDLSFQSRSTIPLKSRHRSRDSNGSHIDFDE